MSDSQSQLYRIEFYVPQDHLAEVKSALFAAGAGRIGNYDCCSWETKGLGQFRPLAGSNPVIGQHEKLEYLDEFKVEMVCEKANLKAAVEAMISAHPYEQPAYAVIAMQA
ncbi:MAG: NGG1p interacting factor NIF3 [SAR86 cluster bacterium]|uniref:NGG1p interacting factor NIF3 n=1 Tax=SAR86 cluster bacterium TaxID=2030880 RepID=A0A2A4MKV0_9GAMM|nr:MAG: NGG1p interacting factor NIF3 [SAR86 cluster bacterium]